MPKVRQRDPNDKVKTKGKKHSKNRKKQTNVSRQMQAAVEQKVKQKQEQQASNEAATTATEQAAVEAITGAAHLAGKASGVVYDKVIRQHTPEQGAVPETEPVPEPQQPEMPQIQRPQYTEQGRRLAVQEYADSHYRSSIPSMPVSEPFQENKGINSGMQPKQKPLSNTTPQNLPKSREHLKVTHNSGAVEMGRKTAIQTHIKAQIEKKNIQQSVSITADTPVLQNTVTPRQSGIAPKTRAVPELNQGNGPKTKDTISPLTDVSPVEQGRRQAIQRHAASITERKQMKAGAEQVQDVAPPSSKVKLSDTNIQSKTRLEELSDSKLVPKTKDTPMQPVTDTTVEQGRRLAVQKYAEAQAEKATLHTTEQITEPVGQVPSGLFPKNNRTGVFPQPEKTAERPESQEEKSARKGVKIKQHSKEDAAPRQKPKSAPKTRNTVETLSPRTVRPEKVNQTVKVLTPAQKATEMGRRKFMKETQKQLVLQTKKAAKAAGDIMKKAASAILKAIQSTITMLVGIFGGVGLAVILMVVLMIGAILASPFGILFSNEPSDGAIPLSSAVAQISMEYSTRLNELQEGEYETIIIEGEPPDWIEVIAVFACHVAGGEDGVDVMVLDADKVDKLRTVFWDMCTIITEEETEEWTGPTTPTDASTEPTVNLTITIEAKTADDMRLFYSFSESQNDALTELLAEDEMLNSLIGDLNISQEEAMELMNGLPSDVSEARKAVVRQALTLVGKVNYFWGGKSLVIGWDERWGQPTEVWAAGSPSTGTIRPYGLDCSGFVDWVFYNVSGGSYVLGHGGGVATQHVYCQDIPWDQAQPGDLIFYPDDSHAGIVGGRDDTGNMMVIHCASGMNNVVITGNSGFSTVGRPYYYGE